MCLPDSTAVATVVSSLCVVTRTGVPAFRSAALQACPSQVTLASLATVWQCSLPWLQVVVSLSPATLTTLPS